MEKNVTIDDKINSLRIKIEEIGKLRDDAQSTGDRRRHADNLVHLKQELRQLKLDKLESVE